VDCCIPGKYRIASGRGHRAHDSQETEDLKHPDQPKEADPMPLGESVAEKSDDPEEGVVEIEHYIFRARLHKDKTVTD